MGQVSLPTTTSQAQFVVACYFTLLLIVSFVEDCFGQLPQLVASAPKVSKMPISAVEQQQQHWQQRSDASSAYNNKNAKQQQDNFKGASQALAPTTRLRRSTKTIAINYKQPNVLTIIQPQPQPNPQQAVQFKPQDALKVQDYYYPTASNSNPNPEIGLQRRSDQLSAMPSDLNIRGRIWEHPESYNHQSISTPWNISPSSLSPQSAPALTDSAFFQQQPIRALSPPQSELQLPTQQAQNQQQQPILASDRAFEGNARDWSGASLFVSKEQMGSNDLDYKHKRRSFVRMLKNAKSLLTDGFASLERSATSSNLMLGSSLLAAAIPLAVYVLPDSFRWRTTAGKSTSSLDAASGPSNFIAAGPRFSLQGRVDSMMGWIERSVEHLPNFPRLHPKECVKRSICEAHNEPDKYGAIGFMLRLLFPATNLSSTDRMDNMEYKVINKYRHAAGYGLARRMESINSTGDGMLPSSSGACKEKYEDCLVSLLDVAQNLIDTFLA